MSMRGVAAAGLIAACPIVEPEFFCCARSAADRDQPHQWLGSQKTIDRA
ncbi:hypothetical protein [Nocardia anaemiae]|nr:hypothetical protein [Nocardia anaemiae]